MAVVIALPCLMTMTGEVPAQHPRALLCQLSAEVTSPSSVDPRTVTGGSGNILLLHIPPPNERTGISPLSAPTRSTDGKSQEVEALKTPSKDSPLISFPDVFSPSDEKMLPSLQHYILYQRSSYL